MTEQVPTSKKHDKRDWVALVFAFYFTLLLIFGVRLLFSSVFNVSDFFLGILTLITFIGGLSIIFKILTNAQFIPRATEDAFKTKGRLELEDGFAKERAKREYLEKEIVALKERNANLESVTKENSLTSFVKTFHREKSYKKKAQDILSRATNQVLIVSTHMDNGLNNEILSAFESNSNIDFRMITKPPTEQPKDGKLHAHACTNLKQSLKAKLRHNAYLHSRLIIINGTELLIGSADLNGSSMDNQREAGVCTKDPVAVKDAMNYFEELWSESKE